MISPICLMQVRAYLYAKAKWCPLVKAATGFEAFHQDPHLLQFTEGQVWDDAQQTLQHAGVGTHKWGVDLIQQHDQLIFVSRQQQVTLWKTNQFPFNSNNDKNRFFSGFGNIMVSKGSYTISLSRVLNVLYILTLSSEISALASSRMISMMLRTCSAMEAPPLSLLSCSATKAWSKRRLKVFWNT